MPTHAYVVTYEVTEAIAIHASDPERAKNRALAVLRNGRPERRVTIKDAIAVPPAPRTRA